MTEVSVCRKEGVREPLGKCRVLSEPFLEMDRLWSLSLRLEGRLGHRLCHFLLSSFCTWGLGHSKGSGVGRGSVGLELLPPALPALTPPSCPVRRRGMGLGRGRTGRKRRCCQSWQEGPSWCMALALWTEKPQTPAVGRTQQKMGLWVQDVPTARAPARGPEGWEGLPRC